MKPKAASVKITIAKSLARITKKKKDKNYQYSNERGDIGIEPKTLKNNKEILQTISVHKFDSLMKQIPFLERHNLPNSHKEISNLNRPLSIKEIESINNNLPKENVPNPNGFTGELYQTFKESIILILHNLFQR